MSKIVVRIGNTNKDGVIAPAFAVDVEERVHADAKRIRPRIENEHQRLAGILREGLHDMLVEKSALSYCGAKVVIAIKQVKADRAANADGKCRVDVQTKPNCPREFVEGAWRIYHNIRNSPKVAAALAEEERKATEELALTRYNCERRHGNICSPCKFDCPCYDKGICKEVL